MAGPSLIAPRQRRRTNLFWPFDAYYGWAIAWTALIVSFASSVFYGPVLSVWFEPIREETGWESWEIAASFTIGSFSGSILTAVIGRVMDRYGTRTIMALSGMVLAGCMVGLAFMQAPWQMWLFFGTGRAFAIAGVQIGTTVAIANWFIRKRGTATSFAGFGLRAGQALVPLAAAAIIVLLNWRWAYGLLAISAVLLVTAPALVYLRRRPEDYGLLPDGEPPPEPTNGSEGEARETEAQWTTSQARKTLAFWLILLTTSIMFFAQTATNLHAAPHFQTRGVSFESSVVIVFIFAAISAVMTVPWGWVMDRVHVRFVIAMVSLLYFGSMVVIINAHTFAGAVLFGVVFGVAQGGWTVSQRIVVPNYFGRRSVGGIRGQMGLITAFINPVGPLAAAWIRDRTGSYEQAFTIFAFMFLAAIVMMLIATPPVLRSAPVRHTVRSGLLLWAVLVAVYAIARHLLRERGDA